MAGVISPEEYGPEERAADRAERFAGYREKRRAEASGYADTFEAGPAVHGYQSQKRADRAARRHDRQRVNAVSQWNKAEYWQERTAGVISNALYRAQPEVRRRRILKLEKLQRKAVMSSRDTQSRWDGWQRVLELEGSDKPAPADGYKMAPSIVVDSKACGTIIFDCSKSDSPHAIAYTLANLGYGGYSYKHPRNDSDRETSLYSLLTDDVDPISPKEAAELWLNGSTVRPGSPGSRTERILNHYANRLAFENAMLENEGGKASEVEMIAGGFVNVKLAKSWRRREIVTVDGWAQILKVNKSPTTKRVTSVNVAGYTTGFFKSSDGTRKEETRKTVIKMNVESAGHDAYREPTTEELEAFNAAAKADKKKAKTAAKASPKPKLINPTPADAAKLQQLINQHGRKKDKAPEVLEMSQKAYSANSKGSYARAGTKEITEFFEVYSPSYYGGSNHPGRTTIFKIRMAGGSVIVLSDKKQHAVPFELADSVIADKLSKADTIKRLGEIPAARERLKAESTDGGGSGLASKDGLTDSERELFDAARYWGFASSSAAYDWGLNSAGKIALYGPAINQALSEIKTMADPTDWKIPEELQALRGCIWAELVARDYENSGFKLTAAGRDTLEAVPQNETAKPKPVESADGLLFAK